MTVRHKYMGNVLRSYAATFAILIGISVLSIGAYLSQNSIWPASDEKFEVNAEFRGIRAPAGNIIATLCTSTDIFPNECSLSKSVTVTESVVNVTFGDIPQGLYAIAAFHDEDLDGRISMNIAGTVPEEGIAFSRDAIGPAGPPSFTSARFDVSSSVHQAMTLRYLN